MCVLTSSMVPELPCSKTVIESFYDDVSTAYMVHLESTISNELLKSTKNEFVFNFMLGDSSWSLVFYTRGENAKTSDYMSLFLRSNSPIHAGSIYYSLEYDDLFYVSNLESDSGPFGVTLWKKRTFEPFKINFVFAYFKTSNTTGSRRHLLMRTNQEVVDKSASQFSGEYDVAFKGNDWTLFAHRELLVKVSPVFQALFSHNMKESNSNTIEIDEFEYCVVQAFLNFIYTGILIADDEDTLLGICSVANKYFIDSLKLACDLALSFDISQENIVDRMIATVNYRLSLSRAFCCDFIRFHFRDVVKLDSWENLVKHSDSMLFITRKMAQIGCPSLSQ